jgi:hypothetical protein
MKTRKFIALFIRARHWSLSSAKWIQSTHTPVFKIHHNIILSFAVVIYMWNIPSGFSVKTLCPHVSSVLRLF